ncbi:MAG: hypothetical protein MRZ79_03890 [Bacteroidia bacterium]|nr:hypothetical protein [Bacteroidia bacterium]
MKGFLNIIGLGLFFVSFLLIGSIWLFPQLRKNSANLVVEKLYEYQEDHGQFPKYLEEIDITSDDYIYTAKGDSMKDFVLSYLDGYTVVGYSSSDRSWWQD